MSETEKDPLCPFCRSPIAPDEARVTCPQCAVVHHKECWTANGKCSVYACDGWAAWSSEIARKIAPARYETAEVTPPSKTAPTPEGANLCIKCGGPVGKNQLVCWRCRSKVGEGHYFENCFGPASVMLLGTVTVVTILVRVLT